MLAKRWVGWRLKRRTLCAAKELTQGRTVKRGHHINYYESDAGSVLLHGAVPGLAQNVQVTYYGAMEVLETVQSAVADAGYHLGVSAVEPAIDTRGALLLNITPK